MANPQATLTQTQIQIANELEIEMMQDLYTRLDSCLLSFDLNFNLNT
jgi:hypothetical protein